MEDPEGESVAAFAVRESAERTQHRQGDGGVLVVTEDLLEGLDPLDEGAGRRSPAARRHSCWNDSAITALNPDLPLPDLAITAVHRSDGSGSTYGFTGYLGGGSPEWAVVPGWPTRSPGRAVPANTNARGVTDLDRLRGLAAWLPTVARCAMRTLRPPSSPINDIRRNRSSSPGNRARTSSRKRRLIS